jgi:hypothetical protein
MDLGIAWLEQYAAELELFAPPVSSAAMDQLGRLDGYLSSTDLAFIFLTADPSKAPGEVEPFVREQLARLQAEFPGRLVRAAADLATMAREPRGHLTWAILGLEHAGAWLDGIEQRLETLALWIDRGVRLIGLDGATAITQALDRLESLASGNRRIAADLGHLTPTERDQALGWFEEGGRSIGVVATRIAWPDEIDPGQAARIGKLGGLLGLRPTADLDSLSAAIEALRDLGFGPGDAGAIGFASDFPRAGAAGTTGELATWARGRFGPSDAAWLMGGSARAWLGRWLGT